MFHDVTSELLLGDVGAVLGGHHNSVDPYRPDVAVDVQVLDGNLGIRGVKIQNLRGRCHRQGVCRQGVGSASFLNKCCKSKKLFY